MDFNSILIGSEDPERLAEYYGRLFGPPTIHGRELQADGSSGRAS